MSSGDLTVLGHSSSKLSGNVLSLGISLFWPIVTPLAFSSRAWSLLGLAFIFAKSGDKFLIFFTESLDLNFARVLVALEMDDGFGLGGGNEFALGRLVFAIGPHPRFGRKMGEDSERQNGS